jgi:hypothetical protein
MSLCPLPVKPSQVKPGKCTRHGISGRRSGKACNSRAEAGSFCNSSVRAITSSYVACRNLLSSETDSRKPGLRISTARSCRRNAWLGIGRILLGVASARATSSHSRDSGSLSGYLGGDRLLPVPWIRRKAIGGVVNRPEPLIGKLPISRTRPSSYEVSCYCGFSPVLS